MFLKKFAAGALALSISGLSVAASFEAPIEQTEAAPAPGHSWYLAGFGGVGVTPDITYKPTAAVTFPTTVRFDDAGWNVGGAVGLKRGRFRGEAQYTFMRTDIDRIGASFTTKEMEVHAVMGNVYYDLNAPEQDLVEGVTPYVGVGAGWAEIDLASSTSAVIAREDKFAYQFMAGIAAEVTDNVIADFGYRYFRTTDLAGSSDPFQNHLVNFGIRMTFDV